MAADKLAALARAGLTILQAALHSSTAQPAKSYSVSLLNTPLKSICPSPGERKRRPLLPGLVSTVDAIAPVAAKFGVLDVKRFNTRMIDIDIGQVVHLLQMQVARVIEHIAARMVIHQRKKTLKGHAIVQVFAGVDLIADIDPCSSKRSSSGRQRRASSAKASSRSG
ncbi:Uncharacterised protein [Serratia liquefaciens]|nr:Uncharacterised protein [Serratia liquefaciens]